MRLPAVSRMHFSIILLTSCLMSSGKPGPEQSACTTSEIAPQREWLCGHGTDRGDHVFEGCETGDGGFVAVGITDEPTSRAADILAVKTDAKGRLQWQRVIGEEDKHEEGRCIVEVADGYVIGGVIAQRGRVKAGLVKLDKDGKTVWTKIYPHDGHGTIRGIDATEDGGIVATGYSDYEDPEVPFIADEAEGFILRTDANGRLVWRKPLYVSQGTKVKVDKHNDGYVACSTVWNHSNGKDHEDACLVRIDEKGDVKWKRNYGGPSSDQCFDMDLTDDGYVLGGHTLSYGKKHEWDAWLVKIDTDGNLVWHRSFGQPLGGDPKKIFDECYGVKTTRDGGFVMACGSGIEPEETEGKHDLRTTWAAYVVRTDSTGTLLWEYTYHTPSQGHNAAEYVNVCRDGGYIVFLDSDSVGKMEEENFGFLKLAPKTSPQSDCETANKKLKATD